MFNELPNYLSPLQNSYQNSFDVVEQQLISLITDVFNQTLNQQIADVQTMGMPHLQSFEQLKMEMAAAGLENLVHDIDEQAMRYLFKIWTSRNQERGTYFLQAVLQVLFKTKVDIKPVYHSKTLPYPKNPVAENDSNGFLTSRIDVTIYAVKDLDINKLSRIASVILPARLVPVFVSTAINDKPVPEFVNIFED
jgi:hypothetical protein